MKELIISDQFCYSKTIAISDCAHVIPRIGEEVIWRTPNMRVVQVQYDYDAGMIYVKIA